MGTMLAAHIYDRTISPHIFIGVVGINITNSSIEKHGDAGAYEVLSGIVIVSAVRYPLYEIDLCSLDSFQSKESAGDEVLCSLGNYTDKVIQTKLVCYMGKYTSI